MHTKYADNIGGFEYISYDYDKLNRLTTGTGGAESDFKHDVGGNSHKGGLRVNLNGKMINEDGTP